MRKRRAKPVRSRVVKVVKPFSTFEHDPTPSEATSISSIQEPLVKVAKHFDLAEPYVPMMTNPRSGTILTLAWLIPVTSPVSVFVEAQTAFRKAVQDGIPLPWYVETPGRRLRVAMVVTRPDEMRNGAQVARLRRVGNKLEDPPKRAVGAKKKFTDAALRASLQQHPDVSAGVRARLIKRELGLPSLAKSTVIRRIKALNIGG